ncbi:diphthine synthase [Trichinella spiralis]|uniref:diphthine synthase n=1 Tax=Trichinella spiralis TaxID=6334 RepID=UPI0001EFEE12|nr:diphthine synthase [Trichinella spiralis]
MLVLVGLGLGGADDITVNGLKMVQRCSEVFYESYTSIQAHGFDLTVLVGLMNEAFIVLIENAYNKKITLCNREKIENDTDRILDLAEKTDCDFTDNNLNWSLHYNRATTHWSICQQALSRKIPFQVVHNASILTAVGCCGLQLYNFGQTVTVVSWTDTWKPDSYFDRIEANLSCGAHTLCLMDLTLGERTIEGIMRNKPEYKPPAFMSASAAAKQLLEIIEMRRQRGAVTCKRGLLLLPDALLYRLCETSRCVGLARIGWPDQKIVCRSLAEMSTTDLGEPLHSLVIVGSTHPLEEEALRMWQ